MSADEDNGILSLSHLQENLAVRKDLLEQAHQLNKQRRRYRKALVRYRQDDENRRMYLLLLEINKKELEMLPEYREITNSLLKHFVRFYINRAVIPVSKTEHVEALRYLKNHGWTGKASVHDRELAYELGINFIPYILQNPENKSPN